ncbi:hypothetical protein KIW84_065719 [Lathyrus oleraceus]|uniref:Uncharacterized protein n=1 Tax=Pisum sativum TaxID=3888 RepID=A0A9D5ACV7_PEA|nr:hypothetical protein KIW84_065719 [Pisum sativum]
MWHTLVRRLDPFAVQLAKGNCDCAEIDVDIYETKNTYQFGQDGLPIHFKRSGLTIQAQIWMTFLLHNVTPTIHTSIVTLKTPHLIWYIMKGKTSRHNKGDL